MIETGKMMPRVQNSAFTSPIAPSHDSPHRGLLKKAFSRGSKVVACFPDPSRHRFFGGFQITPGIVFALVSHLAIDFQNFIEIVEHMLRHGSREGILIVGVHVHFDDAVIERLRDLFLFRARTAMKNEIKMGIGAERRSERGSKAESVDA